jgi:hypothetical protein
MEWLKTAYILRSEVQNPSVGMLPFGDFTGESICWPSPAPPGAAPIP